eukprot:PITA_19632
MYSYRKRDHIYHLKQIFEICQRYGISLNPKKCVFAVTEGKLLGHILSKEGIVIDPERIQTIMRIQPPANKRAMQSFFRKINFVRKFVSNFAEIVCPMQLMMKKYVVYKRSDEAKKAFQRIKEAIAEAPALVSLDFGKEFLLYTFTYDVSYALIPTQKNDKGNEVPISYMSSNLQEAELNYPDVEKQGFALFKAIKYFHPYLLKARTKVIIPHPVKKKYDEIWLRCLEKDGAYHVLKEMHDGPTGSHYGKETIAHKILRARYYWPTVFRDSHAYAQKCKGNGIVESSNKNLICIIRKYVADNQRNWHNALTNALWANRVTLKVTLGKCPYFLVYGQEAILPPNVSLPSLQLSQYSRGTPSALLQERINQLVRLEELRDKARNKFRNNQMIVKRWFDRHLSKDKDYQVEELVLKWNKLNEPKGKHTKFQHLWLGPFQVTEKIGQGTYKLKTLQGETKKLPVNGQHLKRYFQ